jgi:hypothetical protein
LTKAALSNLGEMTAEESTDAALFAGVALRHVGTRLEHSCRVASQATIARPILGSPWSAALVDAAWLHDVGYNAQLAVTGFHPLDGARWLRDHGWPDEVCRLVAWHTEAVLEAEMRGLDEALRSEFELPPPLAQAALTWADLTASPTGARWSVESRLVDILSRYPTESVVHKATVAALVDLKSAAEQVERLLQARGTEPS